MTVEHRPAAPSAGPGPGARPPATARALGALIAVVLLGAVAAVVGEHTGSDGPPHPDEWDPRVAELAAFVEEARDLEFEHPVYVDFLTAAEYSAEVTTGEDELLEDDRTALDRYAAQLRAMGLASGELDLFTAFNQVYDGGTLALYSPADRRVKVRGTELSLTLEVTLVHELTHALQDQHFSLDPLHRDDPAGSTAFRSLAEGDAERIEEAYVDEAMTEEEQGAYREASGAAFAAAEELTTAVPEFVNATFLFPYASGHPFIRMLEGQGGNDAVDDAFDDPPFTEEHLFDPSSYLAGEGQEEVDLDLDDDLDLLELGPLGSPHWYLMLAERIDPMTAFDAALGWAGGAYALYEHDGRVCMRAAFRGDRPDDEEAMADALEKWLAALPGDQARALTIEDRPGFEACDPGPDIDMALTARSMEALGVSSIWGYLVADAASVLDAAEARCYAGHVIDGLTYEQLTDVSGEAFGSEEFDDLAAAAVDRCA